MVFHLLTSLRALFSFLISNRCCSFCCGFWWPFSRAISSSCFCMAYEETNQLISTWQKVLQLRSLTKPTQATTPRNTMSTKKQFTVQFRTTLQLLLWTTMKYQLRYHELFWPSTKLPLNWRKPESNTLERWKNIKEIIINHKETKMVKDGEDWHGFRTTKLKNLGQTIQTVQLWLCSYKLPRFPWETEQDILFLETRSVLRTTMQVNRLFSKMAAENSNKAKLA